MHRFSQIVLAIFALVISSVGHADGEQSTGLDHEALPRTSLLAETMLAELDYTARGRLFHPSETTLFANESLRPFADFDFEDGGLLSHLRKLRGVSVLTMAEVGDSHLFLGVDDKGIVGFHFGAFLRKTKTRHLELLRMPYLARKD